MLDSFSMKYVLKFLEQPITTNRERAGNRYLRAKNTKHWRTIAEAAARGVIPKLQTMNVTVQPYQRLGKLQDTAACNPSVKAAIDGIVDAGVIPDDTGEFLPQITFLPCKRGHNALELTIEGEPQNA